MQGYSSTLNMPNQVFDNRNSNAQIYSQVPQGQMQMGLMNQMGPMNQMGQGPVNPVVDNQIVIPLKSEQLGSCSVKVQCPSCHANIETISKRKCVFCTCLFKVFIKIFNFIVVLFSMLLVNF